MALKTMSPKPFTMRALKRLIFLIFAIASVAIFGFVIGSFQGFLESTQLVLLNTAAFFGSVLFIVSFIAFIFEIGFSVIWHSPKFLFGGIGYIFLIIIGFSIIIFAIAVIVFTAGYS